MPLTFTPLASDNFTRANANPISGSWTTVPGAAPWQILSNMAEGTAAFGFNASISTAVTWPNDQYSEVTVGQNTYAYAGPAVRFNPASDDGYLLFYQAGSNSLIIQKIVAGGGTTLATSVSTPAVAPGDVVRLVVVGNQLSAYYNGTLIIPPFTDTTYGAGSPGIAAYLVGNTYEERISNWVGGSAAQAPVTDDFNRADNTTLGTNWTVGLGSSQKILTNQAASNSGSPSLSFWNANTFSNDQSSTATISVLTGTSSNKKMGVAVRANATSGGNAFYFYVDTNLKYAYEKIINGGIATGTVEFATAPFPAVNDVMTIAVVGTRYYFIVNGHVVGTVVDTSFTSGSPGIFTDRLYNTGGDWRLDNWIGDNQVAFAAPAPTSISSTTAVAGTTFNLTINGTGFQGVAPIISGRSPVVTFSGAGITVNSLSVVSSTQIIANITVASGAAATVRNVIVTNIDTQAGTLAAALTITLPPPSPASISPGSEEQGFTGNITVGGINFDAGGTSILLFSNGGISVNSYGTRNATTIVANITILASASLGYVNVTVGNADTQQGTLVGNFQILSGAPVPVTILPFTVVPCGTENVTVTGTNFTPKVTQNFIAVVSDLYNGVAGGTPSLDRNAGFFAISHGVSVGGNGTATFSLSGVDPWAAGIATFDGATPTVVQDATAVFRSVTTAALAYISNNTAGNTLVVFVTNFDGRTAVTISDSQGNVWLPIYSQADGGGFWQQAWYAPNAKAGANTVTLTMASSSVAIFILEYTPLGNLTQVPALASSTSATATTPALTGPSTLSFSGTGITVNSYSVQNSTTITANITAACTAIPEVGSVTVTNANGLTGTLAASFPILWGVIPAWIGVQQFAGSHQLNQL